MRQDPARAQDFSPDSGHTRKICDPSLILFDKYLNLIPPLSSGVWQRESANELFKRRTPVVARLAENEVAHAFFRAHLLMNIRINSVS